jgi:hypothetical protein
MSSIDINKNSFIVEYNVSPKYWSILISEVLNGVCTYKTNLIASLLMCICDLNECINSKFLTKHQEKSCM